MAAGFNNEKDSNILNIFIFAYNNNCTGLDFWYTTQIRRVAERLREIRNTTNISKV